MSKKIPATITCNKCNHSFPFVLYRSIWGEFPDNRKLVLSNQINVAICPSCKTSLNIPFSFLYTNVEKEFAVWWEPIYDSKIDEEVVEYGKIFGEGNYYQTAPRIHDWEEFKYTIIRFETGELIANPISTENYRKYSQKQYKLMNQSKKTGCLGFFVLSIFIFFTFNYLI